MRSESGEFYGFRKTGVPAIYLDVVPLNGCAIAVTDSWLQRRDDTWFRSVLVRAQPGEFYRFYKFVEYLDWARHPTAGSGMKPAI